MLAHVYYSWYIDIASVAPLVSSREQYFIILFSFLGVTGTLHVPVPFSAAKLMTHPVSKEMNDVTAS
jgi:hypothetical protein